MIPLKDNIPTRRFPLLTVTLILANVAAFLLDQATGRMEVTPAVTREGIPVLVRHFEGGLSARYAMVPGLVTGEPGAYWLTIFTSMFLHANWLHIGGNMLSLWIFGNNMEDTLGRGRFILFYLACGAAAALAHIYSAPGSTVPTVGASGAVAGVMGGYLILFPHARILSIVPIFIIATLMEVPAVLVIGFWALVQFLNASWLGGGEMQGGGIAYFAHIGGFLAGILLILLLGGRSIANHRDERGYEDYFYR